MTDRKFQIDTFSEYQDKATKILKFPAVHQDLYLVGLLNEEAGEVSKLFRKKIENHENIPVQELKLELGDVLWTLTAIARVHGISLDEIVESNLEKLDQRNLL